MDIIVLSICATLSWRIESKLHQRLDVVFREDDSRIRNGNMPTIIMTAIRHICLNLFDKEFSKISTKKKMNRAAWNDAYRAKFLLED